MCLTSEVWDRISQRLWIWHFLFTRIVASDEYGGCLVPVLWKGRPCLTIMERADVTVTVANIKVMAWVGRQQSVHYHLPTLLQLETERKLIKQLWKVQTTKKGKGKWDEIWCLKIPGCPIKAGTDVTDPMDHDGEHKWFGESVKNGSDMFGCQRFSKLISFGLVRFYAFLSFQSRGLRISGRFYQPGTCVVEKNVPMGQWKSEHIKTKGFFSRKG